MPCEICQSRRGTQASERHVRHLKCSVCGVEFEQKGAGRTRTICSDPVCLRKLRQRYKAELRALDGVA